jgi:hypothetical protein
MHSLGAANESCARRASEAYATEQRAGKPTHQEDMRKLRWLDPLLGTLMLDEITLDVIDAIKAEKLKAAGKPTVNRYSHW